MDSQTRGPALTLIDGSVDEDMVSIGSLVELGSQEQPLPTVRLEPGMVLPGTRYRIDRWLGEGGVGVVFECSHVELHRKAALKVLKGSLSKSTATLFREEAVAAAKAHLRRDGDTGHPHGSPYIVDVFDFGELPDGRLWIAMEMLDGVSLSSALKAEGKPIALDVSRGVGILRQVCKGLGAAHRAGVVHRDVKPANVMLVREQGREDAVKLVDFGVAATPDTEARRTMVVGTPPYMAPEQIAGDEFDHRLDVYAFGCLAYRVLVGRVPFRGGSVFETFRAHRESVPRPPSEVNPAVPVSFDAVVLKCLEKDAEDRYPNMDAVEAALCSAQLDAGVATPWDDLRLPDVGSEMRERIRAVIPVAAAPSTPLRWIWPALTVAALTTAGVLFWARQGEGEPLSAAVVTTQNDEVEALVDAARKSAAAAHWIYPDPEAASAPTAYSHVLSLEGLDAGAGEDAATMLRAEFAYALNRLGDRYWAHPDGKAFALDYYVQAALFEPASANPRVVMTPGERMLLMEKAASLEFSESDLRASQPLAALAESNAEVRDQKLLEVLDDGELRSETSSIKLANLLQPEAKARRTRAKTAVVPDDAPEVSRPAEATGQGNASSLVAAGHRALAVASRRKAERLFHQALALDNDNGSALYGLGVVQFDRGAYGKATRTLGRAVSAKPGNAAYRLKLGDAHFKNFQYNDARAQYRKAVALGSKAAKGRLQKVEEKIR